jgi:DNA-binding NtrC family response regulator
MAVILVVEDEEQVRVMVESILVDDGHQTLSAATTAQALAVLQTDQPIDLLFTDIGLGPDVAAGLVHPGLELAQQAVELRPDLRVLYTTGQGITDGIKVMFVPGSEFLPKPYDINHLVAKIAALTSKRTSIWGQRPSAPHKHAGHMTAPDQAALAPSLQPRQLRRGERYRVADDGSNSA